LKSPAAGAFRGRFQFFTCDGAYAAGLGDAKGGAAGISLNLLRFSTLNHRCEIAGGVRGAECLHHPGILLWNNRKKRKKKSQRNFQFIKKLQGQKQNKASLRMPCSLKPNPVYCGKL